MCAAWGRNISTHAPAGGATRRDFQGRTARRAFLLTPLREGRPDGNEGTERRKSISTHAPAGGATTRSRPATGTCGYFYSRPCGRGDARLIASSNPIWFLFLLTPLREGRPAGAGTRKGHKKNFYSRPCGRGDLHALLQSGSALISTHAPAGGATASESAKTEDDAHFYSRPCGRGDSNFPQVRHEVLRQIAER